MQELWYNGDITMRVYLDNCCYNRPFDGQGNLRVAIETRMLVNRDAFDYTQWRRRNLGIGETVDSLYQKIREFSAESRDAERAGV